MGTVFFIVLLILTPAHVTLNASGRDGSGDVFLNFGAMCNREAYDELLAFSTNFSCNAQFNHLLKFVLDQSVVSDPLLVSHHLQI